METDKGGMRGFMKYHPQVELKASTGVRKG
nr:MAG TPA: hypothetical protein [Caudoviricetes sp.]